MTRSASPARNGITLLTAMPVRNGRTQSLSGRFGSKTRNRSHQRTMRPAWPAVIKHRARTTVETDKPANARPSASPSRPRASSQPNPAVVAKPIDSLIHRVLFIHRLFSNRVPNDGRRPVCRLEPHPLLDEIERALLHLGVDAPQVFTEHADEHELDAAEEQNGDKQQRPAGDPDVGEDAQDGGVDDARQGQPGGKKAAPRRMRNGARENDRMLSTASRSIFLSGYLVAPATRAFRL